MFGVEAALLLAGATSGDETPVGGMVVLAPCSDLTVEEVEEESLGEELEDAEQLLNGL